MRSLIEPSGTERFERWKDVAFRMARSLFSKWQNPSLEQIEEELDSFFEDYVNKEYADLYVCWEFSKPIPGKNRSPGYVCDLASELVAEHWNRAYYLASERQRKLYDAYFDREMFEELDELKDRIIRGWENALLCCIRAGLDLAYDPSAVNFTAEDLHKMYPEGVPDWVKTQYKDFDEIASDQFIVL